MKKRRRENSRLVENKVYLITGILLIYHFVLKLIEKSFKHCHLLSCVCYKTLVTRYFSEIPKARYLPGDFSQITQLSKGNTLDQASVTSVVFPRFRQITYFNFEFSLATCEIMVLVSQYSDEMRCNAILAFRSGCTCPR